MSFDVMWTGSCWLCLYRVAGTAMTARFMTEEEAILFGQEQVRVRKLVLALSQLRLDLARGL